MKIVIIAFICILLASQTDAQNKKNANGMLSFNILHIVNDGTGKNKDTVETFLAYDFIAQYPYYKINTHDWKDGDLIQLAFSELPDNGHLYIFSVDPKDEFRLFSPIHLDNVHLKDSSFFVPSKDSSILVDTKVVGRSRICIWYALKNPVSQFEELVRGMEMTHGTMMQRVNWQIAQRLYLPCEDWRLPGNGTGVELSTAPIFSLRDNLVIPIVLEFRDAAYTDTPLNAADSEMGSERKKHKKHRND